MTVAAKDWQARSIDLRGADARSPSSSNLQESHDKLRTLPARELSQSAPSGIYRTDATRMRVLNVTTPAPGRKARMRMRTFGPQPEFRSHRDAATSRVSTIYRPMPTRRPCMSSCSCGRMCAAGKLRADGAENSHSTCANDGSSSSSRISSSTASGRRHSGTLSTQL